MIFSHLYQTMLFSATLGTEVQDLVNLALNQPCRINVDPVSCLDR